VWSRGEPAPSSGWGYSGWVVWLSLQPMPAWPWTDAAQAHNDNLVARQAALKAAWEELKAEGPADWEAAWDAKRREALAAGGFEIVF